MRYGLVFRMEGVDGKVHEYKPSMLNNLDEERKAGLKPLIAKAHGIKFERFMELYADDLEAQGLSVIPREEELDEEAGRTKG